MEILIPVIAVTAIGLIVGLGLSLADKFFAVPIDEKQEKIRESLPGANCGACGFSGCDTYAEALAKGEAEANLCVPGGASTAKALSEILGVEINVIQTVAFIGCGGSCENTTRDFAYSGMLSCAAANLVQGGPLACKFGCLGFGDCIKVCEYDAITIENGTAYICEDLCKSCGKCVKACPKGLISIIPKEESKPKINCSNKQKGAAVAKACKVSCLSCMQCEKACEAGALKIVNNIPVIDYSLCTGCLKCKAACKRGVII